MREFSTIYLERHAKPHKKTWKMDESNLRLYILPALADRELCSISTADVLTFQASICTAREGCSKSSSGGRYAANRCIEQLGQMFRLARDWGYFPEDRRIPTDKVKGFSEKSRERYVDESEMARLAKAIDRRKKTAPHLRAFFWVDLMTGLRRDELRTAMWCDLDLVNKQLRRPGKTTKNGEPLCQPLSPQAGQLLNELPRSSPYIFSAKGRETPVTSTTIFRCWDRIRKEANISDVRLHDLRRTVGSWLAQSGESLALVGKALNHQDLSATQIYARFSNADVRRALDRHSAKLATYITGITILSGEESAQHSRSQKETENEILLPDMVPRPNFPSLAKAINQCAPHLKVFFWLYFMTGLTKDQLLKAKWSDLDEAACSLNVLNRHRKQQFKHPLSSRAVKILSSLPRHSAFIFAPPRKPCAISFETIKGAWASVCGRARLGGLEVRSLQKTAMKLAIDDGISSGIAALALHRTLYNRSKYDESQVREAVEKIAEKIMYLAEHTRVERLV
ncbi:MAG: hypothetical protein C0507_18365 [Cyanobacteria bacterium PR.3.49]|nr:hypothetical protein [Cyanobacteria bacterium PR.3.49]